MAPPAEGPEPEAPAKRKRPVQPNYYGQPEGARRPRAVPEVGEGDRLDEALMIARP